MTGEGTVTIGIEFPDPQQAYRLVNTAVENFLHARHAAEVSTISEAITILEARADQAHQALAASLRDRTSTRLNSSHLVISYAVFCLKKKTYVPASDPRTTTSASAT